MDTADQPASGEQPTLKAEEDTPSGMRFEIHFVFVSALGHSIYADNLQYKCLMVCKGHMVGP